VFWLYDVRLGRLIYLSPVWESMFGTSVAGTMASALGRFEVVAAEDLVRVRRAFDQLAPRQRTRQEFRATTATGSIRVIEERTSPILGEDGAPWRIAGLMTDLTHRRGLEAALQQGSKLELIGQLAGGIAHDFNNLVAAIVMAVEELTDLSQQTPDQLELCNIISSAATRGTELTRQILSFARKQTIETRSVDVHDEILATIKILRRTVDRRVAIRADLRACEAVVDGDPCQLQSAFLNLGINARDAMPNGGELSYETAVQELDEIACAALPCGLTPGRFLVVGVRDTGVGIPPEVVGRVFEPFFTTKAADRGTGLGLAAVYGTAVSHRGGITVESDVGRGTLFQLYLPLAR
jgi:PAS domain S-box-containing protein